MSDSCLAVLNRIEMFHANAVWRRSGGNMRRFLTIALILIASVVLGACSRQPEDDDGKTVDVYYIDIKTSGLVSEKYELISTDSSEQIGELLYMLKKGPENPVYKSALPDGITYTYTLNTDSSLTVDFDSTYNQLTGVSEVLCRAAIVKTLCQLREVEYVQINVNGSPLVDSNGFPVVRLTSEDFIDSTEANTTYRVKLYFANQRGDALVEYDMDIVYAGTTSLEELAIRQLINGPTELGMYDTIPEGTVLLNVSKSDGICTVDFNEKFLEKLPDVDEEVTVYSVVNTLVELPDINKVQFTINSHALKTFWEDLPFDVLFERNLELIEAPK
jgi:germination protein M